MRLTFCQFSAHGDPAGGQILLSSNCWTSQYLLAHHYVANQKCWFNAWCGVGYVGVMLVMVLCCLCWCYVGVMLVMMV